MKGVKIQGLKDNDLFILNLKTGTIYQALKVDRKEKKCTFENLFTKKTFVRNFDKMQCVYPMKAWLKLMKVHFRKLLSVPIDKVIKKRR